MNKLMIVGLVIYAGTSFAQGARTHAGHTGLTRTHITSVDSITVTSAEQIPQGKNVALKFHASSNGPNMPSSMCVGINGRPIDVPLAKDGTYTLFSKMAPDRVPPQPVSFKPGLAPTANPMLKIKFVPCADGCRSVIFHTRCIVCIDSIEF
ncbi:hypothetical protein [Burkholderia ubonensis]|uniref:hypothetical protein n=1 Tax=Burkholderia ubonensis TaxID=101571 RepID=UPI000AB0BA92|nr:hypothetical protein [Burkholderia ubonensis]